MHRAASILGALLLALSLASPVACDGKSGSPYGSKADAKPGEGAKAGGDAKKDGKTEDKKAEPVAEADPKLLDPAAANEDAPDTYKVKFETTKGDFVVEVKKAWAPEGAKRFYNLVKVGFYDDVAFFRAVKGFMVQFGIHGKPSVNNAWRGAKIKDDAVKESNKKGFVTFATSGKDSRTTQVFINYGDNHKLDDMGFSPIGKVSEGMDVVENLHTGYGDSPPNGRGPQQAPFQQQGNAYLKQGFPELDYVKKATIVE